MKKTLIIIAILLALAAAFIVIPRLGKTRGDGMGERTEQAEPEETSDQEEVLASGSGQGAASEEALSTDELTFELLDSEKNRIRSTIRNTVTILTGGYYEETYGILPYLSPYMTDEGLRAYAAMVDPSMSYSDEDIEKIRQVADGLDTTLVNINFLESPFAIDMQSYDSAKAAGLINIGPSESQVTTSLVFSWHFVKEGEDWKIDRIGELHLMTEDYYDYE